MVKHLERFKDERGFGVIGVMVLAATFLIGFMVAETMRSTLHTIETRSAELMNLETFRNNLLVLIKDSRSWAMTASKGPVTGNLIIYDASGVKPYYDATPGHGVNIKGEACDGYPSDTCQLRYEVIGQAMDTTANPIITITIELKTSRFSSVAAVDKTFFTTKARPAPLEANPIIRQQSASWVTRGLRDSGRLLMYNYLGLPNCSAFNMIPGQGCAGSEGQMCQCVAPMCQAGVEVFVCG